jgi:alpha-ketoglutaric semialdehyde dehydrogenase
MLSRRLPKVHPTDYELSSAIYTTSIESALVAIKKLQAGLTYVNHPTIGSQLHMPFGGVKFSGNNREGDAEGINEFTELKTVYINYQNDQKSVKSKVLNNRDPFHGKP